MKPVILIRAYKEQDRFPVQEVVRNYVLSKFSSAFWFCLFKEITLQLIVLATAVFFIFFGIPLIYCLSSVPVVIALIAMVVYFSHYNKAIELSNHHATSGFVAEVYEPFLSRLSRKEIEYCEMTADEIENNPEVKKMKKRIVGTISFKNHNSVHMALWIYRIAIDPEFPYNRIGKPLIEAAMREGFQNGMEVCETVSMECHEDIRELLLKIGFSIRQIYHKSIIGSSLRIMKAQMGINLEKYFRNQKRNLNLKQQ